MAAPEKDAPSRYHRKVLSDLIARNDYVGVKKLTDRRNFVPLDPRVFHIAIEKNHHEMSALLLSVDPTVIDRLTEYGIAALHVASQGEHSFMIDFLMNSGSKVIDLPANDWLHRTPIAFAALAGNAASIHVLMRHGCASIDVECNGRTPLAIASREGHLSVVEALVYHSNKSVNTSSSCGIGSTPLEFAVLGGHSHVIEFLARSGGSIDVRHNGSSLMHTAAMSSIKQTGVIEKLLCLGSRDLDFQNEDGMTPLSFAICCGNIESVSDLIRFGSKALEIPDFKGETPLEMAFFKGDVEIVELLIALGVSLANFVPNVRHRVVLAEVLEKLTEDRRADTRYPIYFGESLVSRLLRAGDQIQNSVQCQLRIDCQ
mgnify:CR=1 FL=1